jgi:hypothetical protein
MELSRNVPNPNGPAVSHCSNNFQQLSFFGEKSGRGVFIAGQEIFLPHDKDTRKMNCTLRA